MQKPIFLIAFFAFWATKTAAIDTYQTGDTLFVWANSGLTIRTKPDFRSKKIAALPYGTVVIANSDKYLNYEYMRAEDSLFITEIPADSTHSGLKLRGSWLQISAGQWSGYVFDAYLSHLQPLRFLKKEGAWEQVEDYAKRVWGQVSQQTSSNDLEEFNTMTFYSNGVSCEHSGNGGWRSFTWTIPNISFEEGYLLFTKGREPRNDLYQHEFKGMFKRAMTDDDGTNSRFIFSWMPGVFMYDDTAHC